MNSSSPLKKVVFWMRRVRESRNRGTQSSANKLREMVLLEPVRLSRNAKPQKFFDIELYCESFVQGNFERAIETAGEHGPELKHKYVALQATNFIRDGKSLDALKLYRRHSAPPYEQVIITW